jgi:hypothetical protein
LALWQSRPRCVNEEYTLYNRPQDETLKAPCRSHQVSRIDHSQIGSTWQAVAQMISAETFDILDHVAGMNDKEAQRFLESIGKDQSKVVLATSVDSGRSEVVFRRSS